MIKDHFKFLKSIQFRLNTGFNTFYMVGWENVQEILLDSLDVNNIRVFIKYDGSNKKTVVNLSNTIDYTYEVVDNA